MATIDWAVLCEMAFLDRHDRLSVIGVFQAFPTPYLPVILRQAMLVAHLTGIRQSDEFSLSVAVVMPDGRVMSGGDESIIIEVAHEYVFVSFRDLPLPVAGTYRFRIALAGQPPAFVDVPVRTAETVTGPSVH